MEEVQHYEYLSCDELYFISKLRISLTLCQKQTTCSFNFNNNNNTFSNVSFKNK